MFSLDAEAGPETKMMDLVPAPANPQQALVVRQPLEPEADDPRLLVYAVLVMFKLMTGKREKIYSLSL